MTKWNLTTIFGDLHDDVQKDLQRARKLGHTTEKGDASEDVWLALLQKHLPARYQAAKAHIVDSEGTFSEQIDVVVFDRQYSPFILKFKGSTVVPAESVYAVFEAKQSLNLAMVEYAQKKVASVRRLSRTSLAIPHAGGEYPPKPLIHILGGVLSLESDWSPAFGDAFSNSLKTDADGILDMGCVAAQGFFDREVKTGKYRIDASGKAATGFLLRLISKLQTVGTVPMIDVEAYANWLNAK